jgi:DNA-3-methyladenine glycosylase
MARLLGRGFFERGAAEVARELIGCVLVRRVRGQDGQETLLRGRMVEVEAYVGAHDLACHAAKGRTGRTEVMFGRGGHAYVYLIYGMYDMLNIVTGKEGDAQAVLVRAAEALDGWEANLSGPGRLAREFQIRRGMNGVDMTTKEGGLWVEAGRGGTGEIGIGPRVGVDYAGTWAEEHLRFFEVGNKAVSKPWPWAAVKMQAAKLKRQNRE